MATYYWRGGSGTWDSSTTTNWSTTSGGSGGAGPPGPQDTVIFNSASNSASYTVQVSSASQCVGMTVTAPSSGNVTFSNTAAADGFFCLVAYGINPFSTGTLFSNINVYSGCIFTPAATINYMVMAIDFQTSGYGTTPTNNVITFNTSGANTKPLYLSIRVYNSTSSSFRTTLLTLGNSGDTNTFSGVSVSGSLYNNTTGLAFATAGNITIDASSVLTPNYIETFSVTNFYGDAYSYVNLLGTITLGTSTTVANIANCNLTLIANSSTNIALGNIALVRPSTASVSGTSYINIGANGSSGFAMGSLTLSNNVFGTIPLPKVTGILSALTISQTATGKTTSATLQFDTPYPVGYTAGDILLSGAVQLTGASLTITNSGSVTGVQVTTSITLSPYSTTALSSFSTALRLDMAASPLTSTNAGAIASRHTISVGSIVTGGTVSLVDTAFTSTGSASVLSWTQTAAATSVNGNTASFGGSLTSGNTSFTNTDLVTSGLSITGTLSFVVNSSAQLVASTQDWPSITNIYGSSMSVSGALTITGLVTNRTNVRTYTPTANGEPAYLTYPATTFSVGSIASLQYVNFQNITASGATPWTGTSLGNGTGNSGITFAAASSRFLVASSGTVQSNGAVWANTSGGTTSTANCPLPQDNITFDNNSASSGAVTLNLASVLYVNNIYAQANLTNGVTISSSSGTAIVLNGNFQALSTASTALNLGSVGLILLNSSSSAPQTVSWLSPNLAKTSNVAGIYPYSISTMTLSGTNGNSYYLTNITNSYATPASGAYGALNITDGSTLSATNFNFANFYNYSNFGSSTIYTTYFYVYLVNTTAYTLSAPTSISQILSYVYTSYVGTLNLAATSSTTVTVYVPSIGTLNLSLYNPIGSPSYVYMTNANIVTMTGGGTGSTNQIYLYGSSGNPATITKTGGGFVQLNYVRPYNLSAAPANTFYATNSSLAPSGTATGWTFSASPYGAAGGNFFLEF